MNLAEFFAMKGYGFYVWGAYGVAILIFVMEIVSVRYRKQAAVRQLRLMREAGAEE